MSEASSEPRWRLTFWSETGGDITEFDFDVEPEFTAEEIVASYYGEREGRTVRVHVTASPTATALTDTGGPPVSSLLTLGATLVLVVFGVTALALVRRRNAS